MTLEVNLAKYLWGAKMLKENSDLICDPKINVFTLVLKYNVKDI